MKRGLCVTYRAVIWSETKNLGLGLTGLVLCCETRSCYACRHKDTATFQVLFKVSLLCAWNITVEINSGVHLVKS